MKSILLSIIFFNHIISINILDNNEYFQYNNKNDILTVNKKILAPKKIKRKKIKNKYTLKQKLTKSLKDNYRLIKKFIKNIPIEIIKYFINLFVENKEFTYVILLIFIGSFIYRGWSLEPIGPLLFFKHRK